MKINFSDTIVALSTAHGTAGIAVIRLSGEQAMEIVNRFFRAKNPKKNLLALSHSPAIIFGSVVKEDSVVDDVLVTVFKKPNSYTGENCVEVSCHGSPFIQQKLLQLFSSAGARFAEPGEFTLRAFLNGKIDLTQAEAVHDLILSHSSSSHEIAMRQMRGGFSGQIKTLRNKLIDFASLIELELDFSEEDVEFANRKDLKDLVLKINSVIRHLIQSFEIGNVIKNGIPIAIVGKPNAGKSTLLNILLQDDKAIVSDIPGTTRDIIEDETVMEGLLFRFMDTAGLRTTTDVVEQIGVNKAHEAMKKSAVVIYLFDGHALSVEDLKIEINGLKKNHWKAELILVANKIDLENENSIREKFSSFPNMILISAKEQINLSELKKKLVSLFDLKNIQATETIVTNARHASALKNASIALERVTEGLEKNISGDLLGLDIRYALNELGNITGEVTSDDLLENIFGKFCIGK